MSNEDTGLKILGLKVKDFKNIEELNLPLAGQSVFLVGKNQSGKSSLIQAIYYSLTGKDGPAEPIRKGEEKGDIAITLGKDEPKYIIKMRFTDGNKKGYLSLETPEGATFSSPRGKIKEIVGNISFDPFKFLAMTGKEQVELVKQALGLNFQKLDARRQTEYDLRTETGRDRDRAQGKLNGYLGDSLYIDGMESDETLVRKEAGDLATQVEKMVLYNSKTKEGQHKRMTLVNEKEEKERQKQQRLDAIEDFKKKIQAQEKAIEADNISITALDESIATADKWLAGRTEQDPQSVQVQISEIDNHNKRVELKEKILAATQEHTGLVKKYDAHTTAIDKVDEEKREMIAKADVPVPGLSMAEDQLMYNDLPLTAAQHNKAEIIKIGVQLTMALSPNLRIVRIEDASLLDPDTLAAVQSLMHEYDYQGFYEVVDRKGGGLKVIVEEEYGKGGTK